MKKIIMGLAVTFSMFFALNLSAKANVTVKVDDAMLNFDVQPEIVNGRTMVPFRFIFEALGAEVSYNSATSEVTASRLYDGNPESVEEYKHVMPAYVKLKIGDNYMETVKDKQLVSYWLDAAPYVKDGRTLVPVRAISESFGADVYWDDTTKTVDIFSNNFFYGASVTIGSSNTSKDMFQEDTFHFYNGKLYFSFDMKAASPGVFKTNYIWDGSNTYSGKMTSLDNVYAIDKVDNRVVYWKNLNDVEVAGGYWSVSEFYTADFNGSNIEKLADKKNFWSDKGKGQYSLTKTKEYEIFSHPQWYWKVDEDGNKLEELTKPGVYTSEDDFCFAPGGSEEYVNGDKYKEQCPAKIEGNTLYYKSAMSEETLGIDIPMARLEKDYAKVVLQTPRYVFVRTLSHGYLSSYVDYDYFSGLYAIDRFENKLITIRTLSSKGDNMSVEQFVGTPSSNGGSSINSDTSAVACRVCGKTGRITCTVCRGSKKVKSYIMYEHEISCRGCNGEGSKSCKACGGDGFERDGL